MSKEVKRWDLRIVNRYAGDGTGEIETDATMKAGPHGRYVLHSDYDALLAERDAAQKDAERYRWLNNPANFHAAVSQQLWLLHGSQEFGERIDKAIGKGAQP